MEGTVNLPVQAYAGSNPAPSTIPAEKRGKSMAWLAALPSTTPNGTLRGTPLAKHHGVLTAKRRPLLSRE